jgi:hypothetical protein
MADRMTDLFLKFSFGPPSYTGIHAPLHDEQRGLPMVNMRQRSRTVLDLRVINRLCQSIAASLGQRDFDLPGETLEFGIRHGQSDAGLAKIREALDMRRIAFRHYDREIVSRIGNGGSDQQPLIDQPTHFHETGEMRIRLHGPCHISDGDATAGFDLLGEQPGWKRFPVNGSPIFRMSRFESFHQRRRGEEIIAADVKHELRVVEIAVEIGKIGDLRNGEAEAALERIVVGPVLPRRKNAFLKFLDGGSLTCLDGLCNCWRRKQRERSRSGQNATEKTCHRKAPCYFA